MSTHPTRTHKSDADADAYENDEQRTFACLVMTARTYMSMTGENVVNLLAVMGENLSSTHKITVSAEPYASEPDAEPEPEPVPSNKITVEHLPPYLTIAAEPVRRPFDELPHGNYIARPAFGDEPALYVGPFESLSLAAAVFPIVAPGGHGQDFDPAFHIAHLDAEASPLGYI